MDTQTLRNRIAEIILPLVEEECLVIFELRVDRTSSGMRLVLLVDRPLGGITLEACAGLNRRIGEAIEGHEVFAGPYMLEVSSPGVDRGLENEADFKRCLQKRVRVFLSEPVEGRLEWEGTVAAADERSVTIEAQDTMVTIGLQKIDKARQVL